MGIIQNAAWPILRRGLVAGRERPFLLGPLMIELGSATSRELFRRGRRTTRPARMVATCILVLVSSGVALGQNAGSVEAQKKEVIRVLQDEAKARVYTSRVVIVARSTISIRGSARRCDSWTRKSGPEEMRLTRRLCRSWTRTRASLSGLRS